MENINFVNSTLASMNLRTARLLVEEVSSNGEVLFAAECIGFTKGGLIYVKAPQTEDIFRVYLEDTEENTGSTILPMEVERVVKVHVSSMGYPIDEEDSPLQSLDYDEDQFFPAILDFINHEVHLEVVNL